MASEHYSSNRHLVVARHGPSSSLRARWKLVPLQLFRTGLPHACSQSNDSCCYRAILLGRWCRSPHFFLRKASRRPYSVHWALFLHLRCHIHYAIRARPCRMPPNEGWDGAASNAGGRTPGSGRVQLPLSSACDRLYVQLSEALRLCEAELRFARGADS